MNTNIPFISNKNYIKSVKVDFEEAVKLKGCYNSDIFQRLCFHETSNFLFGRGLRVSGISSKLIPSDTLQHIINKQWTPFAKDALEDKCIYGYCVYTLPIIDTILTKTKTPKKMKNPHLVDRSYYDLIIHTKSDYTYEYQIVKKGVIKNSTHHENNEDYLNDDENGKFYISFMDGHIPDPVTGKHKSYTAELFNEYVTKNIIEDWNLKAIQQMSHPPILLQRDTEMYEKYGASSNLVNDYVVATNNGEIIKNPNILKTTAPIHILNELQTLEVKSQNKAPRQDDDLISEELTKTGKRRMLTHCHTPEDNIHFIPTGYKMATPQPQMPIENKEIYRIIDYYRDHVFATYQVPVALIFPLVNTKGNTGTGIHLDDSDKQRFTRTLRDRQEEVLKLITYIYMIIYDVDEIDVDIDLPLVPNTTLTQLFNFIDQNVIEKHVGFELILDNAGIDTNLIFKGKNVIDRPRIGGNENTIDEVIKAKTENIEADTKLKEAEAKHKLSEIPKISAETGKITAEKGKVTAEKGKINKETETMTSETNKAKKNPSG